jgi:type II secretory pathway pseudopilin PulG
MIELVFVIVILGILAAVAIPKLVATRDDAKISAIVHSVVLGIDEVVAYAVSQGEMNATSIAGMSNSFARMEKNGDAVISTIPSNKVVIKGGNISDCLTLDVNSTGLQDTLEITLGNGVGDMHCLAIQERIHANNYSIKLRGENVVQ